MKSPVQLYQNLKTGQAAEQTYLMILKGSRLQAQGLNERNHKLHRDGTTQPLAARANKFQVFSTANRGYSLILSESTDA